MAVRFKKLIDYGITFQKGEVMRKKKDLTFGKDRRGDLTFFIDESHVKEDGTLDIFITSFRYIHIIKDGWETDATGYAKGHRVKWE